ncbi:MAG: hypothetical protein Q7S45_00720 [Candidatus Curtissbacteria bacterium]|nr:hypothetical protein [Candidatus Curtissbacteria bacterium]
MLSILLTLILAFAISFIFTMDASPATLYVGTTTIADVPLFYIVFASIIIGVLLASVTTIINLIKSKLTIFGKNKDLKKSYQTQDKQLEKIDKLEEEKVTLKEKAKELRSQSTQ